MESQKTKQRRRREGGSGGGGGESSGREFQFQFQMPLHYPNYTRADYETMPECTLDSLLQQYGLPLSGDVHQKRLFAIGAFLWPYSHFPSSSSSSP
ncbi:hypothetical protein QN277_023805 [Acacia crassicarpa]|uniref:DUF7722 domain-containing protein n=1 Tax=Acacia crassicarpa TaxID=499986 RepID=A0AAE1MME2_9FABA|nr:hypothetical protein QN277_023805 [Acacia crassicarpa]